eukprot:4346357-Pyramimonas_sp.AAC.1
MFWASSLRGASPAPETGKQLSRCLVFFSELFRASRPDKRSDMLSRLHDVSRRRGRRSDTLSRISIPSVIAQLPPAIPPRASVAVWAANTEKARGPSEGLLGQKARFR